MPQSSTHATYASWRLVGLGPRDADRYFDHLLRLDDEDQRLRFFELPPEHLLAMHAGAAVSDGRIVIGCESEGEIRGVGELVLELLTPGCGELAFSVERDWRRRGIGCGLMRAMIAAARDRGVDCLELEMLPDNLAMQHLAHHFSNRSLRRNGNLIAAIDVGAAVGVGT